MVAEGHGHAPLTDAPPRSPSTHDDARVALAKNPPFLSSQVTTCPNHAQLFRVWRDGGHHAASALARGRGVWSTASAVLKRSLMCPLENPRPSHTYEGSELLGLRFALVGRILHPLPHSEFYSLGPDARATGLTGLDSWGATASSYMRRLWRRY
ncbi:MAG: hypothetical protein FE78DRAFT_367168 [Acidomyces sp. 'richmondensis']|nr:MAG: hypothetical protein FE78DRAFT_367168 [Acidomyces sp. 'richmondensis']